MTNRRRIQQAHERAHVDYFLNWFNHAYHSNFRVVSEPNPPEAVIRSSRTTRWLEVSTAFWNEAYAKDLYSYATPGEEHKPVGSGTFEAVDKCFAQHFVSVVKKKLEKKSYLPWLERFGPGYLIVPIKHPWFDGQTISWMRDEWKECTIKDIGCFRSIYITFPSLNEIRVKRWTGKVNCDE